MYSRFHESLAENVSLCMCISRVYVHVDCAVSRKTNKLRTEQVLGLGRGTMVYQHFRSLSLHYVSTLRYLQFFILENPIFLSLPKEGQLPLNGALGLRGYLAGVLGQSFERLMSWNHIPNICVRESSDRDLSVSTLCITKSVLGSLNAIVESIT